MKSIRAEGLLGIGLAILVSGCSSPALPKSPPKTPSLQAEGQVNLVQKLPISAQVIVAGHTIGLEVARTTEQQAVGLMNRTTLANDRGMLFPFEPPQSVKFWMKDTLIPLDMIFLRDGVVKAIAANAPPCTTDPCSIYGPGTPVNQVIELRGGRAAELGLKVGERVKIQFLNSSLKP